MDLIIELKNTLSLRNQQLGMRQMANEYHQRVTNQVGNPHMHMTQVQYGGTPYWNNYNPGWQHCSSTSWNTSYNTLQSPQVQRSSLKEDMDELRKTQTAFTMAQPEFPRSMAEMDYSQVRLPQFFYPNEISQPPRERMKKLEAALVEMKIVHAECATSQV